MFVVILIFKQYAAVVNKCQHVWFPTSKNYVCSSKDTSNLIMSEVLFMMCHSCTSSTTDTGHFFNRYVIFLNISCSEVCLSDLHNVPKNMAKNTYFSTMDRHLDNAPFANLHPLFSWQGLQNISAVLAQMCWKQLEEMQPPTFYVWFYYQYSLIESIPNE